MTKPELAKMLSIMEQVVPEMKTSTSETPLPVQNSQEGRKSFGQRDDRKSFGDRKPFGQRDDRKSFGDRKPFGQRDDTKSFGDRKPYGQRDDTKSFGDRKPYGQRDDRKSFGDRKPYGQRDDRKPYGQRDERKSFGDRKPFGQRDERKPFGQKEWKKEENKQEEEAEVEVDDYIHLDTDTFAPQNASKLKKKFQAKQNFKDYMNTFRHQKGENNESGSAPSFAQKKSNKINTKRPADQPDEQYSSNWMNFLKKQKTETEKPTSKHQKPAKKNLKNAVLTPLRPIEKSYAGLTPLVALDCEMVLLEGNVQALARCSIVNYNGHVLFDKLIRPTKRVENYLPKITGLSYTKLKNAGTYEDYKEEIFNILSGRTIVGHTLKGDFEVIKYVPEDHLIRDLSHYRSLREDGKLLGLKKLTEKHLKFRIQTAEHDSTEDARAAMALYRKFEKEWENELKDTRLAQTKPIVSTKTKKTEKQTVEVENEDEPNDEEVDDDEEIEGDDEGDFDFENLGGNDDEDDE